MLLKAGLIFKIQKRPCLCPGQLITLIGYIIVFPKMDWIQEIYIWVTISLTTINQTPDSALSFSGCNTLCMIKNWRVVDLFVCSKKLCQKISQRNIFEICEKNKIPWWFNIKYNKNNIIVVYQFTIAENESTQVYLATI